MAIRTFNSVGGFSYGENATVVISTDGNISNVANAVIGNITATTQITAGNVTSNNLTDTQVTFTNNGVLSDSPNFTFDGSLLTIIDAANITDGTNYVSITGANGGITTSGNVSFADGAMTVNTDGDVAVSNSFVVGQNGSNGDSAFYVDAAGNFSIKVANSQSSNGFTTVFQVDAATGNVTTTGAVSGAVAGTIAAPGSDTQILFNDGGNVGANANFTFDKSSSTLTVDGNIQLQADNGGYLVLPQGGYIYDQGESNSAILHSDNSGFAQLESVDNGNADSYVWVNSGGAQMEQGDANITVNNDNGISLLYNGSNIYANGDGASISTNNRGVFVDTRTNGNAYIGSNGSEWVFDTNSVLTTPGDIQVGGNIYANAGELAVRDLANVGSLNVVTTANVHGDADFGGNITVDAESFLLGNVTVGNVGGPNADLVVSGNTHLWNDLLVDGTANVGNLNVQNYVTSALIPDQDVTYDLGADGNRWKDLWLAGFTINLGNTQISSTGTNSMAVTNAIIGYSGSLPNYTGGVGNLWAGYLTTSNNAAIGNSTARANLAVSGNLTVDDSTDATSTTTGSFQVKGGVGIGGNIYVGGNANIAANVLISGAEANIATGNLRIGGNANVIYDMVIGGNLTVSGTTTYVNTTNSSLKDPLIDIAGNGSGGDLSGGDLFDRGLYIHNYSSGSAVNQFMGWKQSDSEFQLKTGVTQSGNAISGGSYANLRTDHIFGIVGTTTQDEIENMGGLVTIDVSDYANINGTANIADAIVTSSLTIGELTFPLLDYSSTINPNETIALTTDGEGTLDFAVIHTDRISNGTSNVFVNNDDNVTISVDGTSNVLVVTSAGANVSGTLDVTGELTAGSLSVGSLSPESITLGDTNIDDNGTVTSPDTAQLTIAQVPVEAGNAVEFFVKGTAVLAGVTYMTVATITAVYDGTDVDYATYGKINMGGGAGTFEVNYGGGNIQLLATPSRNTDTVWTAQIRTI